MIITPQHPAFDQIEHELVKMYGECLLEHPEKYWDTEKEKKYQEELRQITQSEPEVREIRLDRNSFIQNKLFINNFRFCEVCSRNFFGYYDELYLNKYECCFGCFIQYVEGREEKWEMKRKDLIRQRSKK